MDNTNNTSQQGKPSVKKNTVYNVLKTLSTIVFPLITFPYISRVLHAANVGKVNFGNSIVSYISLIATLGVTTYAIRECSRVRDNPDELSSTASQIFSINVLSTLVAYGVLALLLLYWPALDGYEKLILIQSASVAFATLGTDWINSAMEDFRYITLRTFAFQLLSLVCMFLFVRSEGDYYIYAIIGVLSSSGANVMNMVYRRRWCRIRFTLHIDWRHHLPPILLLFAMILSQTVYVSMDTTLLGIYRGDVEVGLYSTSSKIYNIANQTVASIAYVVMPRLSAAYAKKDYDEINHLLRYAFGFIAVVGVPLATGIFMLAPEIVEIIGGQEYLGAVPSLKILCVALVLSYFGGFVGNVIMLPSGRENLCLRSAIIAAVVNLVTNLILIPGFGLNAAAATTSFAELVSLIYLMRHIEKEVDLGDVSSQFLQVALGCAAIVVIALVGDAVISVYWVRLIVVTVASVATYYLVLTVTKNEFVAGLTRTVVARLDRRRR